MNAVYERAPLALVSGVLALGFGFWAPSCVDSRCTLDRECPAGQVCETGTGVCQVPECTRDTECATGQVCDDYECVAGCRRDEECPTDHACVDKRCVPVGSSCECPLAPTFCVTDLNPRSTTAGQEVCNADMTATVYVFGNVGCSHCKSLLNAVLALAEEVGGGEAAAVAFIQLESMPVDEAAVGQYFAAYTVPVLPDGGAVDIWQTYSADWYHVVLVDDHGCLAGHWGPLSASDVEGEDRAAISAAWTNALSGACPVE